MKDHMVMEVVFNGEGTLEETVDGLYSGVSYQWAIVGRGEGEADDSTDDKTEGIIETVAVESPAVNLILTLKGELTIEDQ